MFGACYTYRIHGVPTRYIYQTSDLGDAITHVETIFRQGYLTIKKHDRHYAFIPIHDIESFAARILMEDEYVKD